MGVATVIAALITALAAIAAPIIVTFMNNRHAIRIKREEILLNGKLKSYTNLSTALGACRNTPTKEAVDNLYGAITFAAMFSDEETSSKMIQLSNAHLSNNTEPNSNTKLNTAIVYTETIAALRKELSESKCYSKK